MKKPFVTFLHADWSKQGSIEGALFDFFIAQFLIPYPSFYVGIRDHKPCCNLKKLNFFHEKLRVPPPMPPTTKI